MTECKQKVFSFTAHFSRRVEAGFTAGQVSSDGGALLLREVERRIAFWDGWRPVSATAATRSWASTRSPRCSRSGFTVWLWARKI
jgi:hypothetical protein